jgi:fructose-1,6-bisphosphatase/sedoheptulose 1,7-bisphosphatase-like protein
VGQKKANLKRMSDAGIEIEKVEADKQLSPMEFIILAPSYEVRGNLLTDIEFDNEGKLYV